MPFVEREREIEQCFSNQMCKVYIVTLFKYQFNPLQSICFYMIKARVLDLQPTGYTYLVEPCCGPQELVEGAGIWRRVLPPKSRAQSPHWVCVGRLELLASPLFIPLPVRSSAVWILQECGLSLTSLN